MGFILQVDSLPSELQGKRNIYLQTATFILKKYVRIPFEELLVRFSWYSAELLFAFVDLFHP